MIDMEAKLHVKTEGLSHGREARDAENTWPATLLH